MALLRGIYGKSRILTEDAGLLNAEKLVRFSTKAVETRRNAGRLIRVSLGRRGFGLSGVAVLTNEARCAEAKTGVDTFVWSANCGD